MQTSVQEGNTGCLSLVVINLSFGEPWLYSRTGYHDHEPKEPTLIPSKGLVWSLVPTQHWKGLELVGCFFFDPKFLCLLLGHFGDQTYFASAAQAAPQLSTSIWVYGCNHKEYYNSRYHNKCFEENGHNGASYMWSKKSCAQRGIGGRVTNNLVFFFCEGFLKFWASAFYKYNFSEYLATLQTLYCETSG